LREPSIGLAHYWCINAKHPLIPRNGPQQLKERTKTFA